MSEIPEGLFYTPEHEWVKVENDGSVTVGITDHAQNALTDIVYVELPEEGEHFENHDEFTIHSESEPESSASSSRSRGICTTQRGWEFSVPTFNTSHPIALERQLYVAYCHEPAANLGEFTTKAKLFRFHQANPQRTLADPTGAAPRQA